MHPVSLSTVCSEIGKSPVLEAFLDLKQFVTSEKDSDTDFSSDSLQQPKVEPIEAVPADITLINLYSNYLVKVRYLIMIPTKSSWIN